MALYSPAQAIARAVIPGLLSEGLSANAALSRFREAGGALRRQDWLGYWREFSGRSKAAEAGKYTRKDVRPGSASLSPTEERLSRSYRVAFKVDVRDPTTGERFELDRYHSRDSLSVVGRQEEDLVDLMAESPDSPDYEVVGVHYQRTDVRADVWASEYE